MGWAYGTFVGKGVEKCVQGSGGETCGMERDHLEDVSVDGRIMLKLKLEKECGRPWIDLVQCRNEWRAFVNAVMNVRVP
jgi:hypothetical protein